MIRPPPSPTLFPYTTLFRSTYLLPDALRRLRARHPELDLVIVTGNSADLAAAVAASQLDLAVLTLPVRTARSSRSEEHTSELQSPVHLVWRLLLENKNVVIQ